MLSNRIIKCSISKTVQEQQLYKDQHEPFAVSMSMEAEIHDKDDEREEMAKMRDFLEQSVRETHHDDTPF
jgi:hypothetical protein